jgi:hypothetical protein
VPRERCSHSTLNRMRIAPDGRPESPVASHQSQYCAIKTNSFFACRSSSGFAVDPENQTSLRKRRTYKVGALHVLLPSVSPPLHNLVGRGATMMPRLNIGRANSQLTESTIAGSFI